jgi:tRNA nucleotidyltransferase (CCA-adding enzyme)
VLDLRECEADLDQRDLSNREIYHLLRYASTPALMIHWLCTDSERVRDRLWRYEKELRHVQPVVDGAYLKSLGLKPSPLFSRLLHAVRDARLDGLVHTVEEEKALIASLLAERQETQEREG